MTQGKTHVSCHLLALKALSPHPFIQVAASLEWALFLSSALAECWAVSVAPMPLVSTGHKLENSEVIDSTRQKNTDNFPKEIVKAWFFLIRQGGFAPCEVLCLAPIAFSFCSLCYAQGCTNRDARGAGTHLYLTSPFADPWSYLHMDTIKITMS